MKPIGFFLNTHDMEIKFSNNLGQEVFKTITKEGRWIIYHPNLVKISQCFQLNPKFLTKL